MMPVMAQLFAPSFLAPGLAIAGAAAVSIPIIIHILSRRPRKPEPWAAMRFLLAAHKRHRMRTQLEQWLLLATRCLLALLIGLALAGPIWSALGSLSGLGATGRTIVMIFDNSLTSAARDGSGHPRHEALQAAAGKLLDSLGPNDRVALIGAARPVEAIIAPPTADPAAARRQIELLEPVEAAADLPAALSEALRIVEQTDDAGRQTYVALVSDLSAGATPVDVPLPEELSRLADQAKLIVLEPANSSVNVQIAELEPDRQVIVSDVASSTPTVTWTLKLRRFSETLPADELTTVRLEAPDVAPIRRNVVWQAGQAETELRLDMPLAEGTTGLVPVTAALEPGVEGTDALTVDNQRQAIIRVRQKLTVLLLGRRSTTETGLTPRKWLTTVLAPVGDRLGWPIDIREVDATTVNAELLSEADAAFVLRPDLIQNGAWTELKNWTQAGGLMWLFPPADPTPTLWPQTAVDTFGLPWAIKLEPVEANPAIHLAVDHVSPPELARLRADLPNLLRPIEVYRRLVIEPASMGADTSVLLQGADGQPLMIAADTQVGRGRVLLSSFAIDADWTNLPAKPLFVPLIHEVLRAAIDRMQPEQEYEPGDQPQLGAGWAQTPRLTGPDGKDLLLVGDDGSENTADGTVRPIRPLTQAGVYRSPTDALVVNVDAPAGNTLAVNGEALKTWLTNLGDWVSVEPTDPAAPMRDQVKTADLTWPLLWVVAALAVLEMLLARYVSHAGTSRRTADATELTRRAA